MKNKLSEEIESKGLESVAEILHNTPNKLKQKVKSPKLLTLGDLTALQNNMGFTDSDLRLLLNI